jgi:phosphoserine phosphatase RsbU/P
VLGVGGLVLLTGAAVTWLAHRSARQSTDDLPLGVSDDTEYVEKTHGPLLPGQVILVGTDGVWEMPDAKGEQFGKERMRDAVRESASKSAEEISRTMRERLAAFRGETRAVDDVTFVVIKILAS